MNYGIRNMELSRAYKFRLYPDAKRQREIDERLILAQQFYNKILEKSIASYKNGETKVSMAQFNRFVREIIKEDKRYLKLYSQTRCEIEFRLLKAYKNFFRRATEKKKGRRIKVGFPRFKSRDRYDSLTYPQDNGAFSMKKDRLRVSRIGTMRIELHRSIEGKVKTMIIKREVKNYYAIFTAINEVKIPEVKDTNPVGIDLGLNNFIALSDGKTIQKPKFFKKKAKRIAKWQRIVARRTKWQGRKKAEKQSKRREDAKAHLSQEWANVTNQSNDFAHKLADHLINSGYTSFAVEKLNIQNMVKNHNLAQAIHNAAWSKTMSFLSYKAESAGKKRYEVNPDNTTQECSSCHNIKRGKEKLTLKDRVYNCFVCGLVMDRDINASINILNRATLGQRGSHAQGESVRPQREAVLEELRTDKTHPLRDAVIA